MHHSIFKPCMCKSTDDPTNVHDQSNINICIHIHPKFSLRSKQQVNPIPPTKSELDREAGHLVSVGDDAWTGEYSNLYRLLRVSVSSYRSVIGATS